MENRESNSESGASDAQPADRRTFMKAAVKTAVAGAVVAGGAAAPRRPHATAGNPPRRAACGTAVQVPPAVVKAQVLFNNQMPVTLDNLFETLRGIFSASACPMCGFGGVPGPRDPGTVIEVSLRAGYLDTGHLAIVNFMDA